MEVKYQLTRSEYQHMAAAENQRNPRLRARRALMALIAPLLGLLLTYFLTDSLIGAMVAASVIMALVGPAMRWSLRRSYGALYDLIATSKITEVQIDERCLYISRDHIRSEVDWEAITAMAEDSVGYYFSYGPLQSIMLPRRAFASAAEANRFYLTAQEYWQFARPIAHKIAASI